MSLFIFLFIHVCLVFSREGMMDGRKVMNKCLVLEKTREGRTVERTNLSFHLLGKISRFYFKAAIADAPGSPNLFLLHKKKD